MSTDEGSADASSPQFRLVGADRVKMEFMIDDLVRRIKAEGLRPIDSCNGCNNCSAVASIEPEVTR